MNSNPLDLFKEILLPEKVVKYKDNFASTEINAFVGDVFTEKVESYESLKDFFSEAHQRLAQDLLRNVVSNLSPGGKILEIGCGTGHVSNAFLSLKPKTSLYIINDISEQMLTKCKENLLARGYPLDDTIFFQTDISQMPFKPNSLSLIFGSSVIHHLLDYKAFLESVFNTLQSQGQFIITEPISTPYLIAASIIQIIIYTEALSNRPISQKDEEKLCRFCNDIHSRAHGLFSEELLSEIDDKHLFDEELLLEECREIGFSDVLMYPQNRPKPGELPSPGSTHFERFIQDIFTGLEVAHPPTLATITRVFDSVAPHILLTDLAPQKVLLLTK